MFDVQVKQSMMVMFDSLLSHRHTVNNEKVYVVHLHRADNHAGFSDEDISVINL